LRNRSISILTTIIAIGVTLLLCTGVVYLLAGDQIIDGVRTALLRFSLSGREDDLARSVSSNTEPVRFTVSPGQAPASIAAQLQSQSLILDADLFVDYIRAEGLDVELEAGTYFLNQAQTIPEIAVTLTDSRFSQITFTILPGWRIEEVAEAIDENGLFAFTGRDFLQVVQRGAAVDVDPAFAERVELPENASLEGFLYPETYQFAPEVTPTQMRDQLLESFSAAITPEMENDAALRGYNLYEIVKMASIVQREAVRNDEQPKIAGVYFNRLNIQMNLEADPTVQYPLGNSRGTWWARITADDYTGVISDYNTYLNAGLPPSPIANPGLTAILAAIYPEATDFFYFRADCRDDGYHDFARTFEEHLANGC
jgi:UPF0755 protein